MRGEVVVVGGGSEWRLCRGGGGGEVMAVVVVRGVGDVDWWICDDGGDSGSVWRLRRLMGKVAWRGDEDDEVVRRSRW
uniref:Uncharacterized protein n=1 Tax=Tanacetum cinerariifolium TaxID=118510 RepID=A0A6L2LJH0_TANCI|nr:hypothetical protein [Tanacetum cinerariifolium]